MTPFPCVLATNFTWIDGSIVGLYMLATVVAGLMVRKYVGKVEHFLVAGREMNLHLGIASLAATEFGIVTCMGAAQLGATNGFSGAAPGILTALAMLLVGLTGFCIKPLRDAGVVTIPELFEKRYGPKIRWASGVVIVLGGLLNMGVFLRTGGEFLVQVCGIQAPSDTSASPLMQFINTHILELSMTVLLIVVAAYTILGGMLSVLVTDFLQFIVMSVGLIVVTVLILTNDATSWDKMVAAVDRHYGPGGFNPFVNPNMGWPAIVFYGLISFSGVLTWQTMIQRVLASKDTATGRRVYTHTSFFFVCRALIPALWGIAALAVLAPDVLPKDFDTYHAMPRLLSGGIVPVGMLGLLVAAMLAADMSTDSSYMLTWGSVIYNDILGPFRKNISEKRGLLWNRMIVALIGVFLLVYGLWYKLEGNLFDYLFLTGSVYLSSMAVLLIACCYWKRANNWGAAAAIILGALVPICYLTAEKFWRIPVLTAAGQFTFDAGGEQVTQSAVKWIGPYYSGIACFVGSALGMAAGSLLKPRNPRPQGQEA